MSENLFSSKTKADLVQIVRMSGIIPVSRAQKMRKQELVDFLEKEMTEQNVLEVDTSVKSDTREQESTKDKSDKDAKKATSKKASSNKENANKESSSKESSSKESSSKESSSKESSKAKPSSRRNNKNTKSQEKSETSKEETNDNTEDESNMDDLIVSGDEILARPRPRRRNTKSNLRRQGKQNKAETEEDTKQESAENSKSDNKKSSDNKNDNKDTSLEEVVGVLEAMSDGYGFLRCENYIQGPKDVYVQAQFIKRFNLKTGDLVSGTAKNKHDQDRYRALTYVTEVNGRKPDEMKNRAEFERLTPIYPLEKYVLETEKNELSTRIIDLFSPIGKGQRGMIVSPPKAGKTILLQKIANAISINNPESKLFVLLIDERPEEVTDMQRRINGEVVYSTFDKSPENHVKISELVLERAKRLVELGEDVIVLVDSLTRMARAYNLTITPTGRTLTGGLDPGALHHPKRFFGAARNIENGGSLTIIATALIDTGSRMDEVIFEEFKGTGNMEVHLDRKLSERRIFPAIDINKSSTRREELLLSKDELESVWAVRKAFGSLDTSNVTELIINLMMKTKDNHHMIDSLNISLRDKKVIDAMKLKSDNNNGGSYSNY